MFKKYAILKWTLLVLVGLCILLVGFGWWFMNLLPSEDSNADVTITQVSDIPYLSEDLKPFADNIMKSATQTSFALGGLWPRRQRCLINPSDDHPFELPSAAADRLSRGAPHHGPHGSLPAL